MTLRLALVLAAALPACTRAAAPTPAPAPAPAQAPVVQTTAALPAAPPASPAPVRQDPPSPAGLALAEANNLFATDLYKQLAAKEQGNFFFSPVSLSTALGMTFGGARGGTAEEMSRALHFPATEVHEGFRALLDELAAARECELAVANRLWGQRGASFLPDYLGLTRDAYRAPLEQLDFADSEVARGTINRWVEQQTKNRIKDLIPSNAVSAATRLVLTNAVYFKGSWERAFKPAATSPAAFWTGAKEVEAPLMSQDAKFAYAEDEAAQLVRLPYKGGLEMVVVLPREKDGLPQLEKALSEEWLSARLRESSHRPVKLFLPRFKLNYGFEASDALKALGMKQAFDTRADFSGMTGQKDLFISAAIHKAFVEVNEEGTEAAAATAIVMSRKSVARPLEPVVFRADHPFVYLIREPRTGAVLFLGRVVDPSP